VFHPLSTKLQTVEGILLWSVSDTPCSSNSGVAESLLAAAAIICQRMLRTLRTATIHLSYIQGRLRASRHERIPPTTPNKHACTGGVSSCLRMSGWRSMSWRVIKRRIRLSRITCCFTSHGGFMGACMARRQRRASAPFEKMVHPPGVWRYTHVLANLRCKYAATLTTRHY
jgi:hypothetical protein